MVQLYHLWPEELGANGSGGNMRCLQRRLEWRGIEYALREIPPDAPEEPDWSACDLLYLGAGTLTASSALFPAAARLAPGLRRYAEAGGTILAVCEGLELLGGSIRLGEESFPGLGVLDMETVYSDARVTGDYAFDAGEGIGVVYGFANRAGRLSAPESLPPLGRLLRGGGEGDRGGGMEGVRHGNVFGCHAHGPLLPRNPALADAVLLAALRRRAPDTELTPLEDAEEESARAFAARRCGL